MDRRYEDKMVRRLKDKADRKVLPDPVKKDRPNTDRSK